MRAFRLLLRFYSYLVLTAVALAAVAMSALVRVSPHHTVRIGWLPWTGEALGAWLAALGVFGIAAIVFALAGRLRWFFVLFSMAVLWLVIRGFFLSAWQFTGAAEFRLAIGVTVALFLALIGTVPVGKPTR